MLRIEQLLEEQDCEDSLVSSESMAALDRLPKDSALRVEALRSIIRRWGHKHADKNTHVIMLTHLVHKFAPKGLLEDLIARAEVSLSPSWFINTLRNGITTEVMPDIASAQWDSPASMNDNILSAIIPVHAGHNLHSITVEIVRQHPNPSVGQAVALLNLVIQWWAAAANTTDPEAVTLLSSLLATPDLEVDDILYCLERYHDDILPQALFPLLPVVDIDAIMTHIDRTARVKKIMLNELIAMYDWSEIVMPVPMLDYFFRDRDMEQERERRRVVAKTAVLYALAEAGLLTAAVEASANDLLIHQGVNPSEFLDIYLPER